MRHPSREAVMSTVTKREPRRARSYRAAVVVTMAATLVAIGESIDE